MRFPVECRCCVIVPCLSLTLISLTGCGGEGFKRHQVSGEVTFQEKRVQSGVIVFQPDQSVGKLAPTTYTKIENGAYKTPRNESPTNGLYHVIVKGADLKNMIANPDGTYTTPPLFPEFQMDVQIPPPKGKLDIKVPDKSTSNNKGG